MCKTAHERDQLQQANSRHNHFEFLNEVNIARAFLFHSLVFSKDIKTNEAKRLKRRQRCRRQCQRSKTKTKRRVVRDAAKELKHHQQKIESLMLVAHLAESRGDSSGRSQTSQAMERNERSASKKRPPTPPFSETVPSPPEREEKQ